MFTMEEETATELEREGPSQSEEEWNSQCKCIVNSPRKPRRKFYFLAFPPQSNVKNTDAETVTINRREKFSAL